MMVPQGCALVGRGASRRGCLAPRRHALLARRMAAQVIALVAETKRLGAAELKRVADALQTQLTRDFEPIWKIAARVETRGKAADVPASAWPLRIRDKLDVQGAWSCRPASLS